MPLFDFNIPLFYTKRYLNPTYYSEFVHYHKYFLSETTLEKVSAGEDNI